MLVRPLRYLIIPFILLLAAALPACESGDTSTAPATAPAPQPTMTVAPSQTPTPGPSLEGVPGIVDPANMGWPRQVEGLNGIVTIPAKPQRIITASIGHDEMTLALVPNERLVAVGAVSKDETYSNVSEWVQDKPEVTRDPETIIAQAPDVVVTSPFFHRGRRRGADPCGHSRGPNGAAARPRGAHQQHPLHGLHLRRGAARLRVRGGSARALRRPRVGDRPGNTEAASPRRHAILGQSVGRGAATPRRAA